MRIGMVCPYSLDVAGGVQNHVRDLAEEMIARGHEVSVLAPSEADDVVLPSYVVPAGRAVPVPYNGAVGRVMFGPISAGRVRRWMEEGHFDVLHIHEPTAPSLSMLALGFVDELRVPTVATFHMSNQRSRVMSVAAGLLRPRFERIAARIAVSEFARETQVQHVGGEPVIIPNGLYVSRFTEAHPDDTWRGSEATLSFVGRIDEPRKGLPVLMAAFGRVAERCPGLRLNVIGVGDVAVARELVPAAVRDQVHFLGAVDDDTKAQVLRSSDLYVAPNTGGESFGIVLVEAMASGACVVASDIPAFARVLGGGQYGALFANEDSDALTAVLESLLADPEERARLSAAASRGVWRYDWSRVATEIQHVYETVIGR